MNPLESGFLLLTSQLGDPERKPLTVAQLRELAMRVRSAKAPAVDRDITEKDLAALGYSADMAGRVVALLNDRELLEYYLSRGRRAGCTPLTRSGEKYPARIRKSLAEDSPGCLWTKGDSSLLDTPMVSLVGSRDLFADNKAFAAEVGWQAARQGYTLVSGNARGADRTAQEACLEAGGSVICVVADQLGKQTQKERVLYLSEDGFDCAFSSQRALSRNRIIHSLGQMTFVAQSSLYIGGTWSGTVKNLRAHWSRVFCFDDGSQAVQELAMMGAQLIGADDLQDLHTLSVENTHLLIE